MKEITVLRWFTAFSLLCVLTSIKGQNICDDLVRRAYTKGTEDGKASAITGVRLRLLEDSQAEANYIDTLTTVDVRELYQHLGRMTYIKELNHTLPKE